jgi:small subunit ribosomal protein S1
LSIKAKDESEDRDAVTNLKAATAAAQEGAGPKTIGDLIKAQMK